MARTVLYVDDHEDSRKVFLRTFSSKFLVETCASAEDALQHVERGNVAVLLTDQRMPGMTGLELLERVRDVAPMVRRLLVTAYNDVEYRQHLDGCVQGFFVKPWNSLELEAAIAQAIDIDALSARVRSVVHETYRVVAEDAQRREEWVSAAAKQVAASAGR